MVCLIECLACSPMVASLSLISGSCITSLGKFPQAPTGVSSSGRVWCQHKLEINSKSCNALLLCPELLDSSFASCMASE